MTPLICPACAEKAPAGARFCEACGQDLAAEPVAQCVSCEGEVADDGYCQSCGRKQPAERDHQVTVERSGPSVIAAGSDRGRRHHHNEDAYAIRMVDGSCAVLVVCDGVSTTAGSDEVSAAAANACRDSLVQALSVSRPQAGSKSGSAVGDLALIQDQLAAAMVRAGMAAQAAAAEGRESEMEPASTTLVAAVGYLSSPNGDDEGDECGATGEITVGWLGDSRAYWLPAQSTREEQAEEPASGGIHEAVLLTVDHEVNGSLVRWIGADAPDATPEIVHHQLDGPGTVLVCSDGLWRYHPKPADMAARLAELGGHEAAMADPEAMIEGLLAGAIEAGGHDNITAALWPVQ